MALTLTPDERTELQRRVRSLKIRSEDARRARVILMLADGESYSTIETAIPCYRDDINRWRRRFLASRLDGLRPRYCGSTSTVLTPAMEARVLEKTTSAAGRQHAWEYAQAGTGPEDSPQSRPQSVGARGAAAASARAPQGVGRSRLRTESDRRHRPVRQSDGPRRGLRGR